MTAPRSPASPDSLPGALPAAAPDAAPQAYPPDSHTPTARLTLRQEDFCRHYAATGNAAGAARDAGYAAGSARQTGHELLERPDIADRVRAIRAAWRTVEREEAQILLGRLEQAWDAAVEKGSAALMIRVVRLQAELSGLDRRSAHRRAGLWPLPGEEAEERPVDGAEGPIAEAVRRGRHRTERALAVHRANRKALKRRKDFDEAAWLATAQRLHATVEERRPRSPDRQAGRPAPAANRPVMTNPDISLHGSLPASADGAGPEAPVPTEHDISLHGTADAPTPDSVGDSAPGAPVPTEPDISLHRAGLLPAERRKRGRRDDRAGGPYILSGDGPDPIDDDDFDGDLDYDDEATFRAYRARADAAYLKYRLLVDERPGPAPAGADAPAGKEPEIATEPDES
ncbi:MAG: terminase small subunit [Rhodospirillaceae bacterium]|nr:terminase small subunit [Rhodospirillaceae bacterium]